MKGLLRFRWLAGAALACALLFQAGVPAGASEEKKPAKDKELVKEKDAALPPAFGRSTPEGVEDLKAIQKQVKVVLDKVVPATVGLRIGASAGSGVIIDEAGHILTAGHVSGKPDQPVEILLHDGRKLKGKTLGGNRGIDSGMIKI